MTTIGNRDALNSVETSNTICLMAILLALVAIPVAIGIVGFVGILQSFMGSPPSSIGVLFIQLILGIGLALAFLALFVLLALALLAGFAVVFEISLFSGISSINKATGHK